MKSLLQCRSLSDAELIEEIKMRKEMLNKLVGSLYPRIVADEIESIREMLDQRNVDRNAYDDAMRIEI